MRGFVVFAVIALAAAISAQQAPAQGQPQTAQPQPQPQDKNAKPSGTAPVPAPVPGTTNPANAGSVAAPVGNCPAPLVWKECVDGCNARTCRNSLKPQTTCPPCTTKQGSCECPDKTYRNDEGLCVKKDKCPGAVQKHQ